MKRLISISLLILTLFFMVSCKDEAPQRAILSIENDLKNNSFTTKLTEDEKALTALADTYELIYELEFKGTITARLEATGTHNETSCVIEALEFENNEDTQYFYAYAAEEFGRSNVITKDTVVIISTSSTALDLIN